MRRSQIEAVWRSVGALLRVARAALPAPPKRGPAPWKSAGRDALAEFDDYAAANEWELAWDALAKAGRAASAGASFWSPMAEAARRMGLDDRAAAADAAAPRE